MAVGNKSQGRLIQQTLHSSQPYDHRSDSKAVKIMIFDGGFL